jgi:hypothetical protein
MCGKKEERIQKITAKMSYNCDCGGKMERQVSFTAPPRLHGAGFHSNSYPNSRYKGT